MADSTVIWSPADAAVGVPFPTAAITVTFGTAIFAAWTSAEVNTAFTPTSLLTAFAMNETDTDGDEVPFTASIDATNKIVTIVPTVGLSANQAYFLEIIASKVYPSDVTAQTAEDITWTTQTAVFAPTTAVLNTATPQAWHLLTANEYGTVFSLNQGDQDCAIIVNNTDGSNANSVTILKPTDGSFWVAEADRTSVSVPAGQVAMIYIDSAKYCNKDYTFRLKGDGTDLKAVVFSR